MNIFPNEILVDVEEEKNYRVLWIDEKNSYTYLIDIDEKVTLPFLKKVDEIINNIVLGVIIKERKIPIIMDEEEVSARAIEIRDTAWNIIKDIVNKEPEIYISKTRGQLIKSVVEKYNITKVSVYNYLRRYWQRGKTPNALIADYSNSGGKGKPKVAKKKMGRPSKFIEFESKVIVDEKIKRIFRITLRKYYFNQSKNSIPFAHKMMVREFFAQDFYYENGQKKLVISDNVVIPTVNQLRYFLKKEYNESQREISRVGKSTFERQFREILGSSTFETFGPGTRFQIDATIADIYLVSEYNSNWIIGRPVLYFVVDVFSRMIVGLYVGLEGPSWFGAMMAIENTVIDKEKFCKRYDITISKEQWPCEHLPQMLLADRGEFEGYNSDRLNHAFNLHVENAAPYRADWKGIVEKYFDVFQRRVKPFLPGYVDKDFNERGARDYRLDAKLTIKDFTKLMIAEVLYHNNHHYLNEYPRDKDMISDGIKPIPIELWNWGIANRSGKLIYHSPNTVKLHLLPQRDATITERGIRLGRKIYYSCETAIKESWFSIARIKGVWKVKVAYDPRDMSKIYMLKNKGTNYEVCHLVERDRERYGNKSLEDINYLLETEELMSKENKHEQLQSEVNLINQIEEIVNLAIDETAKNQNHATSKLQKVNSISDNHYYEKEQRRKQEKFTLDHTEDKKVIDANNSDSIINEKKEDMVSMDFSRKSIKEIMKQKMNNG